jgi:arsenate reductase (thioredoxin)
MTKVIFACRHSAGRSQMATAFFNQLADPARAHASAAGTTPAERVHPEVVEVMREVGLDLSAARPQLLTAQLAAGAGHLVTMGCGEECPYIPGAKVQDWALDDPKGQPLERVREVRDEIRRRVTAFVKQHGWSAMPDEADAIRRTYEEYFTVFQTLRAEAVAPFYHVPCLVFAPQGVTVMTTSEEVRALLRTMRTALQARAYARSEHGGLQVKVLGGQAALLTTNVVRYAADGRELERFGATYNFRKTDDGWKIAMITIHDPGTA